MLHNLSDKLLINYSELSVKVFKLVNSYESHNVSINHVTELRLLVSDVVLIKAIHQRHHYLKKSTDIFALKTFFESHDTFLELLVFLQ